MKALTDDIARAILRDYYNADNPSTLQLVARKFGVHPSTVKRVVSGETHPHLPRPFKVSVIARPRYSRWDPPTLNQGMAAIMLALDLPREDIAERLGLNERNTARLLANPKLEPYIRGLREQDRTLVQVNLVLIMESVDKCMPLLQTSNHPVAQRIRAAMGQSTEWLDEVECSALESESEAGETGSMLLAKRPLPLKKLRG